ncbi:ribbon-helix-helix domain-containing protein [Lachnospiraceae bacterium OttesenSCG-928-E19]|nr:ribbon-helix-helix domain-containing protein [Lachnospiraceae bacterium OttesenSCG-928-E19]
MQKISISLSGHQTSITLEKEFFDVLKKIATADKTSVAAIINKIDADRDPDSNLSASVRVYILRRIMQTAKL